MKDGNYTVGVSLSGGTGRASVASPARLTAENGEMTARIEWSSPHYDLMIVDGERLLPVNKDGNSVFLVPVADLNIPLDVEAETIAMSEPHLIAYRLIFDAGSLRPAGNASLPLWIAGAAVLVLCAAALSAFLLKRRSKKHA